MKHFLFFLFFYSILADSTHCTATYDDLLMRDIIFIFDNTETVINKFKKSTIQSSFHLGLMTSIALESLYEQAAPVLLTTSNFKSILEYAQLYEDMLNKSNFNVIISKYNDPAYESTFLSDSKFLTKLAQFSQLIQNFYEKINCTINDALNESSDYIEALKIINSKYDAFKYQNLKTLLQDSSDQYIWITAFELLKAYLIIQQLKASNWDIRKVNEFLILAIPIQYLDKVKAKSIHFFKDQNILYDSTKGFDEAALGLSYQNLPQVEKPFSIISYKHIG